MTQPRPRHINFPFRPLIHAFVVTDKTGIQRVIHTVCSMSYAASRPLHNALASLPHSRMNLSKIAL